MTQTPQTTAAMADLKRWFGFMVLIGPIHMGEQLMFGLDQLAELKTMMAAYYAQFQNPDVGTVVLVILVFTLVQSLLWAMLAGGRWQLLAAGFFGVFAVGEGHHVLQALYGGSYFPGLLTSIPFAGIGVMILRAVASQWRGTRSDATDQLAFARMG